MQLVKKLDQIKINRIVKLVFVNKHDYFLLPHRVPIGMASTDLRYTFEPGTDHTLAQIDRQNCPSQILPPQQLPADSNAARLTLSRKNSNFLSMITGCGDMKPSP